MLISTLNMDLGAQGLGVVLLQTQLAFKWRTTVLVIHVFHSQRGAPVQ